MVNGRTGRLGEPVPFPVYHPGLAVAQRQGQERAPIPCQNTMASSAQGLDRRARHAPQLQTAQVRLKYFYTIFNENIFVLLKIAHDFQLQYNLYNLLI